MRYLVIVLALALMPSLLCAADLAAQIAESHVKPSLAGKWPNADKAIESLTDYLGDLAMRQPGGASYEFMAKLLPPLRYVDASFRHYPITLSAPNAPIKARYVSNGSAINALARQYNWRTETGIPVEFLIGEDEQPYGADLAHLDGPRLVRGYLPIVTNRYRHGDALISQEVFCGVEAPYSDHAVVFVKLVGKGKIVARMQEMISTPFKTTGGKVADADGNIRLWFSDGWGVETAGQRLYAWLKPDKPLYIAVFTQPANVALPKLDGSTYNAQRDKCIETWESILRQGMQVQTPEKVVNDAWRAVTVGIYEIVSGDEIWYSAGNQYSHLYVSEGGDAIRALGLWGRASDMRRMLNPLMDYQRNGLWYNQLGKKLGFLAHYYNLTHDKSWFIENRERWLKQVNRALNDREPTTGLFPREQYCADIETPVYSLNVNANAWAGLRDFIPVLEDIGEHEIAAKCAKAAAELRAATLKAVAQSEFKNVKPVFIPNALFGEEKPYERLTAVRLGGYWDLMAPYILRSDLFAGTPREDWIIDYLRTHGGLCMGVVRTHPGGSFYMVKQNNDDLYTIGYTQTLLRRDEVDRVLVSFYGKLAQCLTRDTFVGAEGTCLMPYDQYGRQMYLPPNSASNAFYLWMLRYMLVQDWDIDNNGRPETLRLAFATPTAWLADGKSISVKHAPTAFGEISYMIRSRLSKGYVVADVKAPERAPARTLLRVRLPHGYKITAARAGGAPLRVDRTGAVDISPLRGSLQVWFNVVKSAH